MCFASYAFPRAPAITERHTTQNIRPDRAYGNQGYTHTHTHTHTHIHTNTHTNSHRHKPTCTYNPRTHTTPPHKKTPKHTPKQNAHHNTNPPPPHTHTHTPQFIVYTHTHIHQSC